MGLPRVPPTTGPVASTVVTVPTTTPMAPTGTIHSSSDPNWMSHERAEWPYSLSINDPHHPDVVEGVYWYQYQVDPIKVDKVHCDMATGTIAPWYAIKPFFGKVINHPVCLSWPYLDKALFLSHYQDRGTYEQNNSSHRNFVKGFPICPSNCDLPGLLQYHSRVVQHATMYKIYVPPAHTLRLNCII